VRVVNTHTYAGELHAVVDGTGAERHAGACDPSNLIRVIPALGRQR